MGTRGKKEEAIANPIANLHEAGEALVGAVAVCFEIDGKLLDTVQDGSQVLEMKHAQAHRYIGRSAKAAHERAGQGPSLCTPHASTVRDRPTCNVPTESTQVQATCSRGR